MVLLFLHAMKAKSWSLANYGLSIIFILAIMFLTTTLTMYFAAIAFSLVLISQLILLYKERWDGTHYLGLAFLMLSSIFLLLFVGITHSGVTYIYGTVMILAAMAFIVMEMTDGWRNYSILNRMASQEDEVEEPLLEPVEAYEPVAYRLLAKQGSTTFHREECRTLQQTKVAELIQLASREEAEAYAMEPCKICKP